MPSLRLSLLLFFVAGLAAATPGLGFPAGAAELPTVAVAAPIAADSYAAEIGLQVGDQILSVADLRVESPGEVLYLLQQADPLLATIPLRIRRREAELVLPAGQPLALASSQLQLPLVSTQPSLPQLAKNLGLDLPAAPAACWRAVPERIHAALARLATQGAPTPAERVWLQQFFGALLTLSADPSAQPSFPSGAGPAPEWNTWRDFLQAVPGWRAAQLAHPHSLAPLPLPLRDFVFLYPWSGTPMPELGKLDLGEATTVALLQRLAAGKPIDHQARRQLALQLAQTADRSAPESYRAAVSAALADPLGHGVLPLRSIPVVRDDLRQATIDTLVAELAKEEVGSLLVVVGLTVPLVLENRFKDAGRLLQHLQQHSPYLAGRALRLVQMLVATRHLAGAVDLVRQSAAAGIVAGSMPDPLQIFIHRTLRQADLLICAEEAYLEERLQYRFLSGRLIEALQDAEPSLQSQRQEIAQLATLVNNCAWEFATDERLAQFAAVAAICQDFNDLLMHLQASDMPLFMRDTVAALYARSGAFDRATRWQTWCVRENAASDSHRRDRGADPDFEARLLRYQAGLPAVERAAGGAPVEARETWDDGTVKKIFQSVDDSPVGPVELFDQQGRRRASGWLIDDQRSGPWRFYGADGGLEKTGYYFQDQEIGPWTWYHPGGTVRCQGLLAPLRSRISQRLGSWTWYHAGGSVSWRGAYVDGHRTGTWTHTSPDGKVRTLTSVEAEPPELP